MWHLNVPKILHVYWSGSLPYMRYLTLATFKKFNPTWEIIVWTPKVPSKIVTWQTGELNYQKNWEDWAPKLSGFDVRQVDMEDYNLSNEISEVHKSDFLRYNILYKYGGVYSDMDIIYFKPITNLEVNKKENLNKESFVCISHYGHSNGFFLSAKGSAFFERMSLIARSFNTNVYQSVGPDLCNKHYPTLESIKEISPVENIGMEAVYFYNGQMVSTLYRETDLWFHKKSIGCHWYAGSHLSGKFLKETKGGTENLPNNLMGKLCKISI